MGQTTWTQENGVWRANFAGAFATVHREDGTWTAVVSGLWFLAQHVGDFASAIEAKRACINRIAKRLQELAGEAERRLEDC